MLSEEGWGEVGRDRAPTVVTVEMDRAHHQHLDRVSPKENKTAEATVTGTKSEDLPA